MLPADTCWRKRSISSVVLARHVVIPQVRFLSRILRTFMSDAVIDILHSYLGLATLAIMGHAGLRSIDPMLCISKRAREKFESSIDAPPSYIQLSGG